MKTVSIGLVGVGMFGQSFIQLYRDHPRVRRLALCDLDAERLAAAAKRFKITETYGSLEEICRSDLDALVLITQPWLHAPQAIAAMQSGKHVYSAVPIIYQHSGDQMLDWCEKLVQACRRTGLRYMMGETSYYRPEAMYCRRRAAENAFGHFVLAEGEYFHDIDDPGCSLREVGRNRWGSQWSQAKTGTVPMHYPTHSLGGLLSVMKAHATKVSAIGFVCPNDDWHRADTEAGNVFGDETAFIQLNNNAVVRLCEYRKIGHYGREAFQLFGTEGSFTDGPAGCHWVTRDGKTPLSVEQMRQPLPEDVLAAWRRGTAGEDVYGGHGGSHAYLVHEFVQSLAEDRQPVIHLFQALRFFVPGIMAHKSAMRGGEWLNVPDFGEA